MEILVSFNNTYQSPGYPVLGVLDPSSMNLRFVEWPSHIPQTGVLGMAVSSKYVFLGIQYAFDATQSYRMPPEVGLEYSADGMLASLNPCSLLILDRNNLRVVNHHVFELVKDVHSFLLCKDESALFVVSTGTDEVICVDLDGATVIGERVFWRPSTATDRVDNHHLNSIVSWQGDILVSGFGQRAIADDWNSAQNGCIYNIIKDEIIMRGLQQPHSLAVIDDGLAFCESKRKRVVLLEKNKMIASKSHDIGGYSRGLCEIDSIVFAGTSGRRNKSKSTGKPVKNVTGIDVGCTISRIQQDGTQHAIQLGNVAQEIYDMVPIESTAGWTFRPDIDYKQQFRTAWQRQTAKAIDEIKAHVIPDLPLIVIDEMLLGIDPEVMAGVQLHSFIEKDGIYWGPPENDEAALHSLTDLEKTHKRFVLAFAWPAFWWKEAFPSFANHIADQYEHVCVNDRVHIYSLR